MAGFKRNKADEAVGNIEDASFFNFPDSTLIGYSRAGYYHIHNKSVIYPIKAAPIQIVAGVGAWVEGAKVEIIAAGLKTNKFDIHNVFLGNVSANDDYEINLYHGAVGSEILWGTTAFTRDSAQFKGSELSIQGQPIPAGTRISATLASGAGGNNCYVKVYTHEYPN